MDSIQPISSGAISTNVSRPIVPARPDAVTTSAAGAASANATTQTTAATQTSSTQSIAFASVQSSTSINISQQVDGLLSSIDPALGNNQYLKLLIAALIMQFLLGEDGQGEQRDQSGLAALESFAGRNSALHISIESATNTVQLQQQSSRVDMAGAVQTLSNASGSTAGDAGTTGQQMDISG